MDPARVLHLARIAGIDLSKVQAGTANFHSLPQEIRDQIMAADAANPVEAPVPYERLPGEKTTTELFDEYHGLLDDTPRLVLRRQIIREIGNLKHPKE